MDTKFKVTQIVVYGNIFQKDSFKIVNVCASMNTGFGVDIAKLDGSPYLIFLADENSHYTSIKPKGATKKITIFYNGNMNTVGNKSVAEAKRNLTIAKKFLKRYELKKTERKGSN